jgi:hypothetical protein
VTVGKDSRQLVVAKRHQVNVGTRDDPKMVYRTTAKNDPSTTRGVYRELKKRYRLIGWKLAEPIRANVE